MRRFLLNTKSGMVVTYDEDVAQKSGMVEISESEAHYRLGKGPEPEKTIRSIPQGIIERMGQLPASSMDEVYGFLDDLLTRVEAESAAQAKKAAGEKEKNDAQPADKEPEGPEAEKSEPDADASKEEGAEDPGEKSLSRMSKVEMAQYAAANINDLEETEDDLLLMKKEELRSFIIRREEGSD